MTKLEVEHRGYLTQKKFNKLNRFFKKNGKFLGNKKRFSIIYSPRGKESLGLHKNPVDLKIRITNKKSELVLKYGKWGGKDARREFLFPINSRKFEEMIDFLFILGFYYGVFNATKTYFYKYKNIEFALVEVPNFCYYFEAEMMANKNDTEKINEKIFNECKKLNLKIFSNIALYKLLDKLNNRPGYRFNFKKQKFSEIKKRFIEYFK